MEVNELSKDARGGTEQMLERLHNTIEVPLLDQFQIIPSRVRELKEDKFRIFWCHDLPGDGEATAALGNNKWERFHKIVFVSNWQMQHYIDMYKLPWSRCVVLANAIEPIKNERHAVAKERVNLIYHTTPHRGLNILLPVFDKLYQEDNNLSLDVYSSFGIYGWNERDKEFEDLFEFCRSHPGINYHGAVPNEQVREALTHADIFAYPSTWPETSCIALIEAMSAGCISIHPNFAALFETAGQFTFMYQMQEDTSLHASYLYTNLKSAIELIHRGEHGPVIHTSQRYADQFYDWSTRAQQWTAMLKSVVAQNPDRALPSPKFVYRR